MAVDNTYTSATYDAYITAAECDTFLNDIAGLFDSDAYDALSTTKKENLIKYASRELNQFTFSGVVSGDVLAGGMKWPRSGVYYSNNLVVSATAIPDFVKRFTAYRVVELIANQFYTTRETDLHTKKIDADGTSIEFFDPKGTPDPSTEIWDLPSYREIAEFVMSAGDTELVRA